jgi:hypothetical protein
MSHEVLLPNQQFVRGTDSNSLLRLYDQANVILDKSPLQQERARAGKAIERISEELRKRNIPF